MGLVLLMWIKIRRVAEGRTIQPFQHPTRAGLRKMPDVARAFGRDPQLNHLVIGPKRAVHEYTVGGLHGAP